MIKRGLVTDFEYKEPDNEQLANFLVNYAPQLIGGERASGLNLNADILKKMLDETPLHRAAALRHHRAFSEEVHEQFKKMARGALQCDFVRQNGKRCPNFNEPGSFYCGLHKPEDEFGSE